MSADDGSRSSSSSLKSWFTSLSKGVQWLIGAIITAGALAGAFAAISALWAPDPEQSAEIDALTLDRGVSLETYTIRHGGTALAPSAHLQLAAVTLAQAETVPAEPSEPPAVEDEAPTTTPTAPTTEPETTTTGPEPSSTEPGSTDQPPGSSDLRDGLREGMSRVLTEPETAGLEIPQTCVKSPTDPLCGAHFLIDIEPADEHGPEGDDPVEAVAERVTQIFRNIRTGPVDQATGKRPLMGVGVNFDVSLTGFSGRSVNVYWSLHRIHNGVDRTPVDWLTDQHVQVLHPHATTDKASPEFWAPLPKGKGSYFIRVEVNAGDTRIAVADTPHFR